MLFRGMLRRIFAALGCRTMLLNMMSILTFHLALELEILPRCKHLTMAMAERMNRNMVFDYVDAKRNFGFSPMGFFN